MNDLHKQSLDLWYNYQNTKPGKEKQDANYELQEFKRKQTLQLQPTQEPDIDQSTQNMLNESGGSIV